VNELLSSHDLALVDAIAARVVELFDERERLVDAQTLAGILGINRETVYDWADRFGAVEIGDGERPRLRFDVELAREVLARETQNRRVGSKRSQAPEPPAGAGVTRRRRRAAAQSGTPLMSYKGFDDEAAPARSWGEG
jgi:hypothetical protein